MADTRKLRKKIAEQKGLSKYSAMTICDALDAAQSEISALKQDAARYTALTGALIADLNGEVLTPAQLAVKEEFGNMPKGKTTQEDFNASIDRAIRKETT